MFITVTVIIIIIIITVIFFYKDKEPIIWVEQPTILITTQ